MRNVATASRLRGISVQTSATYWTSDPAWYSLRLAVTMLSENPPRVTISRPTNGAAPSAPVSATSASARRHDSLRPIQIAAASGAATP